MGFMQSWCDFKFAVIYAFFSAKSLFPDFQGWQKITYSNSGLTLITLWLLDGRLASLELCDVEPVVVSRSERIVVGAHVAASWHCDLIVLLLRPCYPVTMILFVIGLIDSVLPLVASLSFVNDGVIIVGLLLSTLPRCCSLCIKTLLLSLTMGLSWAPCGWCLRDSALTMWHLCGSLGSLRPSDADPVVVGLVESALPLVASLPFVNDGVIMVGLLLSTLPSCCSLCTKT